MKKVDELSKLAIDHRLYKPLMSDQIYSARYSGVDVYELIHPTGSVMKRKKDNWVNATHILKAANFPKARRTRILEKEILKEIHEKVQGGFGKYQGTWVPVDVAIRLAQKFDVYNELKSLFDFTYIEGAEEPPLAPKHHHASKLDSRKKATKSISMSALMDKTITRNTRRSTNANNNNNSTATANNSIIEKSSNSNGSKINSSIEPTSQFWDTNSNMPSELTSAQNSGLVPTVVNPVVTRRRGRPPLANKVKRKLGVGVPRSQSDIGFSKPSLPPNSSNTTVTLKSQNKPNLQPLSSQKTSSSYMSNSQQGLNQQLQQQQLQLHQQTQNVSNINRNDHLTTSQLQKVLPHFKEIDIDDGLSSDIEPTSLKDDTHILARSTQQSRHSSIMSSPSLTNEFSDPVPFDNQRFDQVGTSPIVSGIPRYNSSNNHNHHSNNIDYGNNNNGNNITGDLNDNENTNNDDTPGRPLTSDINDKINLYLTKLVDYFISNENKNNETLPQELLEPPSNCVPYIDVPIDPELHTAFHWACSMGNLQIIEALYNVGTSPRSLNALGQTPLMRSAMFHNSYTKRTFTKIFQLLHDSVFDVDSDLHSVIHLIVKRKSTTPSAMYYLGIILSKIKDFIPQYRIETLLNSQDIHGDTPLHIAARNGDKTFFDILTHNGALSTIVNKQNETPNELFNKHFEHQLSTLSTSQIIGNNTLETVNNTLNHGHTANNNNTHNDQPLNQKNDNIHNENNSNTISQNQKEFILDENFVSPSDFIMYPSQAATTLTRGIPTIIQSMKELSDRFNTVFQKNDDEIKKLKKNVTSLQNNISQMEKKTVEICDCPKNEIDQFLRDRDQEVQLLSHKSNKLKRQLRCKIEKRQKYELMRFFSQIKGRNEDPDNSDNDNGSILTDDDHDTDQYTNENERVINTRLRQLIKLTLLQFKRKLIIKQIIKFYEGNGNIHKYRKMISEGTDLDINEIDESLDVILQSLEDQQSQQGLLQSNENNVI